MEWKDRAESLPVRRVADGGTNGGKRSRGAWSDQRKVEHPLKLEPNDDVVDEQEAAPPTIARRGMVTVVLWLLVALLLVTVLSVRTERVPDYGKVERP